VTDTTSVRPDHLVITAITSIDIRIPGPGDIQQGATDKTANAIDPYRSDLCKDKKEVYAWKTVRQTYQVFPAAHHGD